MKETPCMYFEFSDFFSFKKYFTKISLTQTKTILRAVIVKMVEVVDPCRFQGAITKSYNAVEECKDNVGDMASYCLVAYNANYILSMKLMLPLLSKLLQKVRLDLSSVIYI